MEKIKTIVIIILGVAVTLLILDERCVINIIDSTCDGTTPSIVTSHCDDSQRYNDSTNTAGGGELVSITDARQLMQNFTAEFTTVHNRGIIISKRALDLIFDLNASSNALVCHFTTVPSSGIINVIFEPINTPNNLISERAIDRHPAIANSELYFTADSFCPDFCGDFQ